MYVHSIRSISRLVEITDHGPYMRTYVRLYNRHRVGCEMRNLPLSYHTPLRLHRCIIPTLAREVLLAS